VECSNQEGFLLVYTQTLDKPEKLAKKKTVSYLATKFDINNIVKM
jgi:hypothetical protein